MATGEVVEFIETFAKVTGAPVLAEANVTSLRPSEDGYQVTSSRGEFHCRAVIIASGACNQPVVPAFASALPASIEQLTPFEYRNPDHLAEGWRACGGGVRYGCAAGHGTGSLGAPSDPLGRRTCAVAPDLPWA